MLLLSIIDVDLWGTTENQRDAAFLLDQYAIYHIRLSRRYAMLVVKSTLAGKCH